MRNKMLALGLVILLFMPFMFAQDEQNDEGILEEVVLVRLPPKMEISYVKGPDHEVTALSIFFTDFDPTTSLWSIHDHAIDYVAGSAYWLCFIVVNHSNTSRDIRLEMTTRGNRGGKRNFKIWNRKISENTCMLYKMSNVGGRLAPLGIVSAEGRVVGLRAGLDNMVKSKVYVY